LLRRPSLLSKEEQSSSSSSDFFLQKKSVNGEQNRVKKKRDFDCMD
jgi:hypothetical protein